MGHEWEATTVGELVTRGILERPLDGNHGSNHPRAQDFVASGVPFIMASNLVHGGIDTANCSFITMEQAKSLRKGFAKRGDVLLSHKATLGRTAIVSELPGHFVVLTPQVTYYRVKDPTRLNNRYLKYYFDSESFQQILRSWAGAGSTRAYIGITDQLRLPVVLPPLPEQGAIAHILGALDDKIELNRRMSETLEAMARALFKSWFVDFDPVRAKAEGRNPGLPEHLADLFPDRLVGSQLGEIPEGWEVGRLGVVAEHPRRTVGPEQIHPGTAYIGLEHMPKRCIALSQWGTGEAIESNKFEFRRGEILFGKLRPYFHKVGVAPLHGVCSTDIVVVAPRLDAWFGFALGHLSSTEFVEYTHACSTGTKMPRTKWADMARYELVVPPEPVGESFTTLIRPTIDRIIQGVHESWALAAQRDALLPKLISGELRVKDATRFAALDSIHSRGVLA
jgi:type I restriction enzyme S subunit